MSQSQDDLEINDLSTKCSVVAEDLLAELKTLKLEQSGFRHAIKKSFRVIKQRVSLKEKQALLEKYQQVLDTRILLRLDSRSLKEAQNFHTLNQDVRNLVMALEQGHRTFARVLADHSQDLKEHIDKGFEKQRQVTAESSAHQKLLKSLFFPEIVSRQEQISEAFKGTYQWIFDSSDNNRVTNVRWSSFHDWLKTSDGIYWITGKPGSGKSTLMKFIVHEDQTEQFLNKWKQDGKLLMISFFFWRPGSDLQKSVTGLLRSLLYQIASQWPELTNHIGVRDENATASVSIPTELRYLAEWTDQRLLYVLECFLDRKPSSLWVCALIDGLDEFIGEEEHLLNVIRIFGRSPQCKVCVSSRPEQAFRQEFRLCSQLRVQELNREDIYKTVAGKLSPHLAKYTSPNARESALEWAIVRKAEGVFLWLDLMIKILIRGARNEDSYDTLLSKLEKTPDTINGMYMHIWDSLDSFYKEEGLKYFHTLLAARELRMGVSLIDLVCAEGEPRERVVQFDREYFVSEQFISSCRHLETRLIACCGGFLEIRQYSNNEEEADEEEADEELKDDQSRDGESDSILSKIPVTVPYSNTEVDFVHRTAFDFVRGQHSGPRFCDSASYLNAEIRLCAGTISQLVVSSLEYTHKALYQCKDLLYTFSKLITFTSATECLNAQETNTTKELPQSLGVNLTEQLFQLLQHLYTFFDQTDQDPFTDSSLVQRLLASYSQGWSSGWRWRVVRDRLGAAAYFGCHNYVHSRLLTQSNAEEHIPNLLQCVISGTNTYYLFGNGSTTYRKVIAKLLTIRVILKHHFEPNALLVPNPHWELTDYGRTLWGATFGALMHICSFIGERPIPDSERLIRHADVVGIIERFLHLGANPNTRMFFPLVLDGNRGSRNLLIEASPLALVDFAIMETTSFITKTQASLRASGAFSYIYPRYFYSGDRPSYFRLSEVQSKTLNEALGSNQTKVLIHVAYDFTVALVGSARHKVAEIINSFTFEEAIGEQTMLEEIASLPESF